MVLGSLWHRAFLRNTSGPWQGCPLIDADPVNKTLFQYRALEAKPLQLLHDGAIDSRHDAAGYSQQPFRLSIGTGLEQTQ